jgi:hypothetical protein
VTARKEVGTGVIGLNAEGGFTTTTTGGLLLFDGAAVVGAKMGDKIGAEGGAGKEMGARVVGMGVGVGAGVGRIRPSTQSVIGWLGASRTSWQEHVSSLPWGSVKNTNASSSTHARPPPWVAKLQKGHSICPSISGLQRQGKSAPHRVGRPVMGSPRLYCSMDPSTTVIKQVLSVLASVVVVSSSEGGSEAAAVASVLVLVGSHKAMGVVKGWGI